MEEKNRNRQDPYRSSQYDWNDQRGRQQQRNFEEEPNYTISENRGFRDSGRYSGMQSGDTGWGENRFERELSTYRGGDAGADYNTGRYGRQSESDYDRGRHESDYSRTRAPYERDYEGTNRGSYENRGNRLGAGNYGPYGNRGRYEQGEQYGGSRGSQYGGTYGRSEYRDRDYGRGEGDERSWWDRTRDEVTSWFGDEGAEGRREMDRYQSGQYRGKGPRNYTRSDERIREDINDRLSDDPFVDASDIEVTVNSGEVTLTGTVDHRSTKRRAEDLAEAVSGVKNVENRLRVGQFTGSQSSGVSGMNNPSGSSGASSSPVAGSERSRSKENSYATNK